MFEIIGDSQIHCLRKPVRENSLAGHFRIKFLGPGRIVREMSLDGSTLNPKFAGQKYVADGCFVSLGGGEHAKTWSYRGPAFDIALNTIDAYSAATPLFSTAIYEHHFRTVLGGLSIFLRHIRDYGVKAIWLMSAPPPPVSNDFIAELWNIEASRKGALRRISGADITSPSSRLETWRIMEAVKSDICREVDVRYLGVPYDAVDDGGFIKPHLAKDGFHGNEAYGNMLIQQIRKEVDL